MSAARVSRREAAAGGIAMLLLAAAAAGQAKADELDGELIGLCQEFHRIEDQLRVIAHLAEAPSRSAEYAQWEEIGRPLVDRLHEVRFDISQLTARTPEGLQAKARVVLADLAPAADPDFASYDPLQALGHSLARDILGRAGA